MRGRTFATLYTVVRLCLLLSLTIGPFVVERARIAVEGGRSNGSVKIGTVHLSLPGARLALWFGGLDHRPLGSRRAPAHAHGTGVPTVRTR